MPESSPLIFSRQAWADPAPCQFGTSKAFYDDYRWQRQVTENMSVGRRFAFKGRTFFEVRAEFFNVFNRTQLRMPTADNNNPLSTRIFNSRGEPTGGFGYINPTGTPGGLPRNGQIVARFQF